MIHIYSSPVLRYLAEQCAKKVRSTVIEDPFIPHTILVPNLDTARWLRLRLTESNGITANIEFMLPSEWQWKQVRKLHSGLPKILPSDRGPMKWALYHILSDGKISKQFPVLHRYITAQKDVSKETAIYQLSGKLSSLFDEYIIYRPEMMNRWENGQRGKGDEKWQSELWRELVAYWTSSLPPDTAFNRAQLFTEAENALEMNTISPEPSLSVFNTGLIPPTILRSLQHCGEKSDLGFFIVQPSASVQNPVNRVIKSFGEDAQNIAALYGTLKGVEKKMGFEVSDSTSLLGTIRNSIILDGALPTAVTEPEIPSVQIRSCHSPLREIETLHEFLLEQFERDDNLAPDDIAVVTPNPDRYMPFVDAVFNHREPSLPVIPHHLGSSGPGSGTENILQRLLDLLDSRFEFDRVMDFFQSEIVRNRFGLSDSQTASVRQWMQDNHVVWGFDGEHRGEWGQPVIQHQTWKSALDRGWLGQWIGENEDDGRLYYHRVESAEQKEVWAAFSAFINELRDASAAVKKRKTIAEWIEWLGEAESSFIYKSGDSPNRGRPLQRLFDLFNDTVSAIPDSVQVPFRIFKTEVEQLLNKPGATGAVFTRGVTFSSMVPLRSIPFKIIALIGLNDQEFPRRSVTPDFDLMARNPQPGERNRKFEDRNLFLESILAAENIHYCSYTGQSPEDNETLPPSTIVSEWASMLGGMGGKNREEMIKKEPLAGFSPSAYKESAAFSGRYFNALQKMKNGRSLSGLLCTTPLPASDDEKMIAIGDLARFYKNPMQYFIDTRFGGTIREEDSEKGEFTLDHLETHLLFQKVFGWVLADVDDEVIQKRLKLSGVVPDGWPGEKLIKETIDGCAKSIGILKHHQLTPGIHHRELSVVSDGVEIKDDLLSYSGDRLVDVSLSKPAGKVSIQTWVRHLIWNIAVQPQESYLICNVKKGDPILIRFSAPAEAEKLLANLLSIFKQGLTGPLPFFPDTISEYLDAKTEEQGIEKAADIFEGGRYRGERDQQAVQILLGPDVPFNKTFLKPEFVNIVKVMNDHMDEVKR